MKAALPDSNCFPQFKRLHFSVSARNVLLSFRILFWKDHVVVASPSLVLPFNSTRQIQSKGDSR
jgi:hypothetical protein